MARRNVAVVLAGGSGTRAGFGVPKQFVALAGRPLLAHALAAFDTHPGIDEIAVVTSAASRDGVAALVTQQRFAKVGRILTGGRERSDSSLAAVRAFADDAAAAPLNLLFHDAARPLVDHRIVSDVIAALSEHRAVATAVPAVDTVLLVDPGTGAIRDVPDRRGVRLAQTPQGFHHETIRLAYDRAALDPDFRATDDCGVVLRYVPEQPVHVVDGARANLKLTYADDLALLERFCADAAGKALPR